MQELSYDVYKSSSFIVEPFIIDSFSALIVFVFDVFAINLFC